MREFQLIALTLPSVTNPSIAIAASRAGGIGVLDLEYVCNEQVALTGLVQLAKYGRQACGVKLDAGAESFMTNVTSELPEQITLVILARAHPVSLPRQVQTLRQQNRRVVLETSSLEHALLGEEVGVDGLIVKGHEAGGRVSEETSFILLQRLIKRVSLPIWVQGGIGLHTAAACYTAGAAGVVLDAQLALTRESVLPEMVKASIARMDGSETRCLGSELGESYRIYTRPGLPAVQSLQQLAQTLAADPSPRSDIAAIWRQEVCARVGWDGPERHVWLLGQEAAFAASLAERFRTVGGVLEGMRQAITAHIRTAKASRPLAEAAVLARSHGTRYPIVQGPMTRVSDRAAFAARVAEGGGLPFLALALMRASEVEILLEETRRMLGDRPWGVGILGFVPLELRQEQLEVIRAYRPSFTLIAGGRPDQALTLEHAGIPTYLHVPSPGLLKLFVEKGARRFVFEGRECGGHVGPRSSFVLWNTMVDTLLESLSVADIADCHVLFAGGIHDAISASMVAAMAAPLAERGVKIGVLLGTAYLFTKEAVATGAILEGFQQEAIRCTRTVLLETGPGHATRCAETPYTEVFERERQRLFTEGRSPEEIRNVLEELNLGRLRVASKGINHHPKNGQDPHAPRFVTLSEEEQRLQGMYMIGQVAALRDSTCAIEELHHEVSVKGSDRLAHMAEPALASVSERREERPCDVAIVGMACLLPKAPSLQAYWENILNKVDAITEIPEHRWDWRRYFDPDPKAPDKIYSKWGGFLEDVPFDPMRYGMPPNTIPSIEPLQLLTLEVVRAALQDAGYLDRPFPRQHTSVILGVGGGAGDLGQQYAVRSGLPMLLDHPSSDVWTRLPEWTEDSFAGILLNVAAGRVANRFDLGGVNYTVDAACASSLAAIYLAVRELEAGISEMVIVGGADTVQNPFAYLCFSKTHALSPRGWCRTFDESADGIAISEGLAVLVLKRLADAERDGDRIYAVIKGVAGSSDGRDKGLTAPRPEGQVLALQRAYSKAGFSPSTVGLIEAHGTGTVAGDQAEVESLKRVFEAEGAKRQSCAIGSVKSMIGHTKCTAGVAGLVKIALALYHKTLPPTLHVKKPNSKARFLESPFYVNTEPRPWLNGMAEYPRRAGVSAFGFGGTNFHAVLEEYTGNFLGVVAQATSQEWPGELLLWRGSSRQELLAAIEPLAQALARGAKPALRDLAYTLWQLSGEQLGLTLAVIATSLDDLRQKLAWALEALRAPERGRVHDPRGIYFAEEPLARDGKVAFMFSGQGSQYPDMLCELSIHFLEVREQFELADRVLAGRLPERLSSSVFPPPSFSPERQKACQEALAQTNIAQPALGAASMGLFRLLQALGVQPDMVAGHSYGEYAALCSAGVFSEEVLYTLSEARGRCIMEEAGQDLGTMAAVAEGRERIGDILKAVEGVWIANINAPRQTVISGTRRGVEQAIECLGNQGIQARPIPVACAFHSPVISPARDRLATILSAVEFNVPHLQVFSNVSAAPYPNDPKAVAALLAEHLVSPVQFADEVEAMYRAGAHIFVEVGPRHVLTSLTEQILGDRPHLALASDAVGRSSLLQLHHTLGQLAAHGVLLKLDRFYEGRVVRRLNLTALEEETCDKPLSPTTWLVNGGRARPLHDPVLEAPLEAPKQEKATGNGEVQAPVSVTVTSTAHSAHAMTRGGGPSPLSPPQTEGRSLETSALPPDPIVPVRGLGISGTSISPSRNDEAGRVMLQFQQLMNRFLETQQQVMLAYLRGSTNGMTSLSGVSTSVAHPNNATPPTPALFEDRGVKGEDPRANVEVSALNSQFSEGSGVLSPEPSSPAASSVVQQPQSFTDREQLTKKLVQVVSERTGYPPEMVDLDLNVEADLGIDSIKRVEILSTFLLTYSPSEQEKTQEAMEQLTGIKTLRGVVDAISNVLQTAQAVQPPIEPSLRQGSEPALEEPKKRRESDLLQELGNGSHGQVEVPRFLLKVVDVPLRGRSLSLPTDRIFLITDDEQGVAHSLAERLRSRGGRVALVKMDYKNEEMGQDVYTANLTDQNAVAELLAAVHRRQGPIAGLIHLLPLKAGTKFKEMDLVGWRGQLDLEVKSLLYLAKAVALDLKQAGKTGESWLVAATSMGGTFANDCLELPSFFPSQGGIAGLVKTLALEWPQVRSKVIDLDVHSSPFELADCLLAEITTLENEVEVGYKDSRRLVLRPRPAPLNQDSPTRLAIDSSWVWLITGGARGITAEVARDLAVRYRPTLILVGRSAFPQIDESADTIGLIGPELKKVLIQQLQQRGESPVPAQIEAIYTRVLHDREIRQNISAMRAAGATVLYYQVDVRDEKAFSGLIADIYESYGRLDAVIHGAGLIEDKLLEDKLPDSFDRVLHTKIDSALILSRKLRPESLKLLTFFSSVAGRFGNRGQSDYAAANEVLNKLALFLDRTWLARVVAINWGPWEKTGMVSSEVERQFIERGVQIIPPAAGCHVFNEEICLGVKGEGEVILGGGPWDTVSASDLPKVDLALPLLKNTVPSSLGRADGIEVFHQLDPSCDIYLQDHRIDGKPVFPMAMAMELMAEVVQQAWPEWHVSGIHALRVLRGIVLENGARTVHVVARPQIQSAAEEELRVHVEILEAEGALPAYYRGTVHLSNRLSATSLATMPTPSDVRPFPMTIEDAYQRWLFHGPCFQRIVTIEGANDNWISAIVQPSLPQHCLRHAAEGRWLIDPIMIDCGFQLAILWARAHHDMTPLPSKLGGYRRFGTPSGAPIRCRMQAETRGGGTLLFNQFFFSETNGRLLGVIEDMESTCSKALNRLGRDVIS